ncbi:3-phosphoserine/phosphohydroxythreonine transaminase [Noviherbaspirillum autotrophicum]|uniref:Phosphoserine aminotransferase n=1 Tax=Noviherbaspirillum autotrophicum TaxID=709839 RepID=A0A0C2BU13_9BURK|nr:3-phosphoserine/phosphohydroxythreonine transaminase [Noviherbaspirillum autotrophicum]KIF83524.1 MFS transporter [Noviherbaspirillum autotrophicum]
MTLHPSHRVSAVWNFAAGPSRLPDAVLARAGAELFDRGADGAAAIERPFSGAAFRRVLDDARERLARLLAVPDNYRVLFLAGGAMHQFSAVPMNLLDPARGLTRVAYADSGYWSKRAMQEASRYAQVIVVAGHAGERPLSAPATGDWRVPPDCAYCHLTANETVDGLAYPAWPDTGDVPLVADATSCFLGAPFDVSRFGLIYASAQKNIGPAGMTVVIVREDLLQRPARAAPSPFCYRLQAASEAGVNTPPTLAIQLAGMVFEWLADCGGLTAVAAANRRKADLLYSAIDSSGGFYTAPVAPGHRSTMNVRFHLTDDSLTEHFLLGAEAAGLTHLRGHRQVGGLRASLYNAMPLAGVGALVDFMAEFQRRRG